MIELAEISECVDAIKSHNTEYISKTRDIFSARLESYISSSQKYLEAAILGELGNNTFDHNINFNEPFERGVYFNTEYKNGLVIVADFGRGLLDSLRQTQTHLNNDEDAIKTAFLERVSGRFPESRGNGLKFVLESLIENKWEMFYKSGTASVSVSGGKYSFQKDRTEYKGCLAILRF